MTGTGKARDDVEVVFVEATRNLLNKRRKLQTTSIDLAGTRELYDSANRLLTSAAQTIIAAETGLTTLNLLRQRLISVLAEQQRSDEVIEATAIDAPRTSLADWRTISAAQYKTVRIMYSHLTSHHITKLHLTSHDIMCPIQTDFYCYSFRIFDWIAPTGWACLVCTPPRRKISLTV